MGEGLRSMRDQFSEMVSPFSLLEVKQEVKYDKNRIRYD